MAALTKLLMLLCSVLLICSGGAALAGAVDDIKAGNAAARAGKYAKALKLFDKAIESKQLSPYNLAVAYNNRGSAKDDQGDTDEAVRDFNQAIQANPKYAEAYYNRSFAYERKGLIKLAVLDIEKAVRLMPDDRDFGSRLEYLNAKLAGGK